MPMKINVGVNKKVGLPDYGSAGSHCNIELEMDFSVIQNPEEFHKRVEYAYQLCRESVEGGTRRTVSERYAEARCDAAAAEIVVPSAKIVLATFRVLLDFQRTNALHLTCGKKARDAANFSRFRQRDQRFQRWPKNLNKHNNHLFLVNSITTMTTMHRNIKG